ncbi:MAG: sigma 54-interacting transcriptional regulator [Phycisphaerales bacterium]|nr:sigma 54-interacting transcriptional regulator [Phycisphaerales bacterium]
MHVPPREIPHDTLSALLQASSAINSSLDLNQTLQTVALRAVEVIGAEGSCVLLLDRQRHKLVFKAVTGVSAPVLLNTEFDADFGIAGRVVRTSQPTLVTDVRKDESFFPGIDEKSGFTTRGLIAAPLIHKGQVIGVVEVVNKTGVGGFSTEDTDLLQIFANLAASGMANAQRYDRLRKQNLGFRTTLEGPVRIIGQSPVLSEVLELCGRVSGSNATVLVLGETGTGKELISRYIHNRSPRRDNPFVALQCAALPETLLESELFGHEKGAFTGAAAQKIGRFEMAAGGTIFLDEIGDISPSTQIKLLRVLQEKEFVRLGGTETVSCDVRIIAATNRDLPEAMREGRFRKDLYYRLNVFPIVMPPLRQRREDIPLLVTHFIENTAGQLHLPAKTVSGEALAMLVGYAWPGNIRELQNVLERAVLLCDGQTIEAAHLPREIIGTADAAVTRTATGGLWDYEKTLIAQALAQTGWNQSQAARKLGISRDNLRYRIKKFGIEKPRS